jgi:hypothetical protein
MSGTIDWVGRREPDWRQLLKNPLEIEIATDHWARNHG